MDTGNKKSPEKWLVHQGTEHDNERWLLDKLCQKLHQDKISRPSTGTLERVVGGIAELLHEETRAMSILGQINPQVALAK